MTQSVGSGIKEPA